MLIFIGCLLSMGAYYPDSTVCSVLTVGEVKGCCCRWKSVGVIVGVDCGIECGVSGTCM